MPGVFFIAEEISLTGDLFLTKFLMHDSYTVATHRNVVESGHEMQGTTI